MVFFAPEEVNFVYAHQLFCVQFLEVLMEDLKNALALQEFEKARYLVSFWRRNMWLYCNLLFYVHKPLRLLCKRI